MRGYVNGNGKIQTGAYFVLHIEGLPSNVPVYWAYHYKFKEGKFSSFKNYSFNRKSQSSQSDESGSVKVLFTTGHVAGDRLQFGASLSPPRLGYLSLSRANIKSPPIVLWKRLYLEYPKVLQGVHFPLATWNGVTRALNQTFIELILNPTPQVLDPKDLSLPDIFYGPEEDLRYGPRSRFGYGYALQKLTEVDDSLKYTINLFILGAHSRGRDLIKGTFKPPLPQPVDYAFPYKSRMIEINETGNVGTGLAAGGHSPCVIVWSDYWYMCAKKLKVPHHKMLARVLLHEIGHHLLKSENLQDHPLLDQYGHLRQPPAHTYTIMGGYTLDPQTPNRRFIKKPKWHPKIKSLIQSNYIPLKQ